MGSSAAVILPEDSARDKLSYLSYAALGALGLALGLSQAIHGSYDESAWAPIALGTLAVLLASAIGARRSPPVAAVIAVLALLGLALWSLVSSGWGSSTDAAWIAGDRWLLYAAALAVIARLVAGERHRAEWLLTAAAAGVAAVAAWMLVQMLRHHGASLFLGSRLNDPLGYVNGQAGYLLAGVWPACALAERRRPAPIAALGLGALVAFIGLGALTRSRSWELGLAASTLLVLIAIPGRRRRATILLIAGVAIFAIHGQLSAVSGQPIAGDGALHRAALAIILAAIVAGISWGIAVWLLERLAPAGTRRRAGTARLAAAALLAAAAAGVGAVALNGSSIVHSARAQYRTFVHLTPGSSNDRLLSGAGNRYDYWRVAGLEFRSQPWLGVGAGNYQPGYYRHRRTTEAIQQPHSLELQTLAELGLVGVVLLGGFLAAVGIALARAAARARVEPVTRGLVVAAGGLFAGWLVQTSVDWEHLIPGLTLIALAAAAVLLTLGGKPARVLRGRPRAWFVVTSATLVCAGAVLITPRVLSLRAQASAQHALDRHDPRAAIVDATRALEYDTSSVPAFVLRAAAFARLDAFVLAQADLRRALRTEPQNWVTWALMGDLLTRHGQLGTARAAYRRALTLNPREPSLAQALEPAHRAAGR